MKVEKGNICESKKGPFYFIYFISYKKNHGINIVSTVFFAKKLYNYGAMKVSHGNTMVFWNIPWCTMVFQGTF